MSDFNQQVIDEFRANGGKVAMFGDNDVVIVHCIGAKSGAVRETPLVALVEGDRKYIIASAAGATSHPAWYHNLKANPDVDVEHGTSRSSVTATELGEPERTDVYGRMAAKMPQFDDYKSSAGDRVIPVFALDPR